MTPKNFDCKSALADLFAGTVNQQTLEEAAKLMVSVSAVDLSYHIECLAMLGEGIRAAQAKDLAVIDCINKSGYQVSTIEDAVKLLVDFYEIYLIEYERASN